MKSARQPRSTQNWLPCTPQVLLRVHVESLRWRAPGAIGQAWLRTFDLSFRWRYRVKERVAIQPGISFFNVFNFSNFDGPAVPFGNILNGQVGSPNGTTNALEHGAAGNFLRLGLGSGVNALGAPRAIEFQLKVSF